MGLPIEVDNEFLGRRAKASLDILT
jgi:hypothetical protein